MKVDYPENGEPPIRSALSWPVCNSGEPKCPDAAGPDGGPEPDQDEDGDSPLMAQLRECVRKDIRRRNQFGPMGRTL